ncbi:hypothetical protein ADL05_21740 [Nocardiopsis sp. NRRL B-16309]|nr:hypothetical protein ADL05_21740 [Nocardiopsis sp. NRRL B-16309]
MADELVIDTRSRRKSVRLNGVRAYQHLADPGSTLWPLPTGENTGDVTPFGMGEESRLILRYTPLAATV